MLGAYDVIARIFGWLFVELLFSRPGLWLILSAVTGVAAYVIPEKMGVENPALLWVCAITGFILGLIFFYWGLNIGSFRDALRNPADEPGPEPPRGAYLGRDSKHRDTGW
jgi:hypothetical protein